MSAADEVYSMDFLPPSLAVVQDADEGSPWRITDDARAEWALRLCARALHEISAVEEMAEAWRTPIDQWLEERTSQHRDTLAKMTALLERYALDLREADPARKSVTLPGGVVRTTAKAAAVKVTDEKATLAWALEHFNEAVSRDPKLRVSRLKETVKPVQLVTAARFTHSCGDMVTVDDPMFSEQGLTWPEIGSEVECPECRESVLLGKVDVLATRWVLSLPVPGVDVEPPTVTAKVVVG